MPTLRVVLTGLRATIHAAVSAGLGGGYTEPEPAPVPPPHAHLQPPRLDPQARGRRDRPIILLAIEGQSAAEAAVEAVEQGCGAPRGPQDPPAASAQCQLPRHLGAKAARVRLHRHTPLQPARMPGRSASGKGWWLQTFARLECRGNAE
jgi:hypothetical protein